MGNRNDHVNGFENFRGRIRQIISQRPSRPPAMGADRIAHHPALDIGKVDQFEGTGPRLQSQQLSPLALHFPVDVVGHAGGSLFHDLETVLLEGKTFRSHHPGPLPLLVPSSEHHRPETVWITEGVEGRGAGNDNRVGALDPLLHLPNRPEHVFALSRSGLLRLKMFEPQGENTEQRFGIAIRFELLSPGGKALFDLPRVGDVPVVRQSQRGKIINERLRIPFSTAAEGLVAGMRHTEITMDILFSRKDIVRQALSLDETAAARCGIPGEKSRIGRPTMLKKMCPVRQIVKNIPEVCTDHTHDATHVLPLPERRAL